MLIFPFPIAHQSEKSAYLREKLAYTKNNSTIFGQLLRDFASWLFKIPLKPILGYEDGHHHDVSHIPFIRFEGKIFNDFTLRPFLSLSKCTPVEINFVTGKTILDEDTHDQGFIISGLNKHPHHVRCFES